MEQLARCYNQVAISGSRGLETRKEREDTPELPGLSKLELRKASLHF